MRVGVVVDGSKVQMVPVVIAEDDGANVQVVSGLGANDKVIQNPTDSLIDGQKVLVVSSGAQSAPGGK